MANVDPGKASEHRYDWIFDNLSNVVGRFAQNPGILACLFGLAGDYAEFDQIWKENAHQWNLRVAEYPAGVRSGATRLVRAAWDSCWVP